jgi:serralysin
MCGICAELGVNIHVDGSGLGLDTPLDFSLDPFAGGTYQRTATSPIKKIFSLDQVKEQIDSGQKLTVGADKVITFGFFDHQHALGLNNNPGFGEGAGYTAFSEAQKTAARGSIGLWDDLIAPSFAEAKPGPGASDWGKNTVDIWMANTSTGPGQAWAYYPGYGQQYTRIASDAWIADPANNWTNSWFSPGGYGNTTLIHELGHSLGLSHPGAYNGTAATNYDGMAEYAQDSMQYSIMSYWSGQNTRALTVNWSLLLNNYAQTPMLHDIVTIQAKYGADPTTRTGDTTYGFNSNAGRDVYDFAKNPFPYLSIYDAGGNNDTIDLSGFTASQFINLQPGSFSSVGAAVPTATTINANAVALNAATGSNLGEVTQAQVNGTAASFMNAAAARIGAFTGVGGIAATAHDNLSIAYGTIIENAIGGSGRDLLWGNDVANRLEGRGGNDVLNGFKGADTLVGGAGDDVFQFSTLNDLGNTILDFTAGDKIDVSKFDTNPGAAGDQAFSFIGSAAFGNVAGQLRYANGVVEGDVDGDGRADFSVIIANNAALTVTDFIL